MTPTTTMTRPAVRSDSQIQQDVLRELKWDTRVRETEVGVSVKQGIVTLSGIVDHYAKKVAASKAAHRVTGVLDVVNDLSVKLPGFGSRTDPEIAEAVRNALRWDEFIPESQIHTTVGAGVVTLEGEVSTWAQREDAVRCIERLSGVMGVVNNLRVKPSESDSGRVREAIEQALERRAEREAKRIEVSVRDGTVVLTGTTRSWGERRAVERAAGFAPGVKRIDSRLVIDPYS
jgi:osmotically-inducible protein OsmY